MKQLFILMSVLLAAPLLRASTCETRVDSHQKATTLERVDYCLTPEQAAPQAPGPTIIYENVTAKEPERQTAQKPVPLKQKYYPQDEVEITRGYVGTERFPQLKNDIPSERELLEQQQAQEQETKKETSAQKPERVMAANTADIPASVEPSVEQAEPVRPVKYEQKPARTMVSAPTTMMQQIETEIIAPAAVDSTPTVQESVSVPVADDVTQEADALFYGAQS